MKYTKSIFFFLSIIFLTVSLFINIMIVKSKKIPQFGIVKLNGIYFDLSLLKDKQKEEQMYKFVDSNNMVIFSNVIIQKEDPVGQFYAFCGFMKSNQKRAIKYLEELLFSPKKVNIYLDKETNFTNTDLGLAILLVISEFPKRLTNPPIDGFYLKIEELLLKAYQSNITKKNKDYKKYLLKLISLKSPNLAKEILNKIIDGNSITSLPIEDQLEISFMLQFLESNKRKNIIQTFLSQENEQIVLNTIKSIKDTDSHEIAAILLKLIYNSHSSDIIQSAIEKYCSILKADSLSLLYNFMTSTRDSDAILTALTQIKNYGNESNYEFLKNFLKNSYSEQINLEALKAIVQTTYKTNPDNVLNTMVFLLRKGKEITALYTIRFIIDNNIQSNSGTVLFRIRQKESLEMKKIAIEYIDHFKLLDGFFLIKELANDANTEISEKANQVIIKYNDIFKNNDFKPVYDEYNPALNSDNTSGK